MLAVAAVELADEIEPVLFAVGDLVEDLFHLRGKPDIDIIAKVIAQQPGHANAVKLGTIAFPCRVT